MNIAHESGANRDITMPENRTVKTGIDLEIFNIHFLSSLYRINLLLEESLTSLKSIFPQWKCHFP